MEGAAAHASDAAIYPTRPARSGPRRPRESLSGPASSWPPASPSMQPVSVNWPVDAESPRSRVNDGSPGRYMSIESGPNADRAPRISVKRRPGRLAVGSTAGAVAADSVTSGTSTRSEKRGSVGARDVGVVAGGLATPTRRRACAGSKPGLAPA